MLGIKIDIKMIEEARERIRGIIFPTDMIPCTFLESGGAKEIYLKTENLQRTGSFKIRGAYNKMACLSKEERGKGVIAASAGNHAQGVALAAKILGIPATIVMPTTAPLAKIVATKAYGADVVLHGIVYDDAQEKAKDIQLKSGAAYIHAFNDPLVIAGQGTIGLEILEAYPEVDTLVVPVGGGGLAGGIALAAKSIKPSIRVIGVEPILAASMYESFRNNRIETLISAATIADGVAVKTPGELTYALCRQYLDDIVLVEEDEIANMILMLLEKAKIVAEGSGVITIAALKYGRIDIKGRHVVAVLSGGNMDVTMLARIIDKGLVKAGRKVEFTTVIKDSPGQLSRILEYISNAGANIVTVHHDRTRANIQLGYTQIELVLETQDQDHLDKLIHLLRNEGYGIVL